MKCSIEGCPGEYENQKVIHTVCNSGKVTVINHVPAEVCSVCGDVLFPPSTVRHIEVLLKAKTRPACTVPMYEFV